MAKKFDDISTITGDLGKQLDFLKYLMAGVVFVVLLGMVAVLQDYLAYKQATYADLRNQVQELKMEVEQMNSKEGIDGKLDRIIDHNSIETKMRGW